MSSTRKAGSARLRKHATGTRYKSATRYSPLPDAAFRATQLVSIALPAWTWREIESELRKHDVWWLANKLVNTNSPVFSLGERSNAD